MNNKIKRDRRNSARRLKLAKEDFLLRKKLHDARISNKLWQAFHTLKNIANFYGSNLSYGQANCSIEDIAEFIGVNPNEIETRGQAIISSHMKTLFELNFKDHSHESCYNDRLKYGYIPAYTNYLNTDVCVCCGSSKYCVHTFVHTRSLGRCYNEYKCIKCGEITQVDSSD